MEPRPASRKPFKVVPTSNGTRLTPFIGATGAAPVRVAKAGAREGHPLFVWFDRLGIGLSGLCVVHCLVTPFLLLLLPALETSAAHEGFHRALLIILPPLALLAFIPGFRKHRRAAVFALGVPGLALIALGALAFDGSPRLEAAVSMIGSAALIGAHLLNRRALARAGFGHVHLHGAACGNACGHVHKSSVE